MEKLHYSVIINAPLEKVWDTMLEDETYRQWTDIFNPGGGSSYEGDWSTRSVMKFLGPDKDGNVSGMYSEVKENRPHEFLSIRHLGEIINGEKKPWPSEEGAEYLENYTFKETEGGTEVLIDVDTTDEFKKMFEDMWPKALEKLKGLAEK